MSEPNTNNGPDAAAPAAPSGESQALPPSFRPIVQPRFVEDLGTPVRVGRHEVPGAQDTALPDGGARVGEHLAVAAAPNALDPDGRPALAEPEGHAPGKLPARLEDTSPEPSELNRETNAATSGTSPATASGTDPAAPSDSDSETDAATSGTAADSDGRGETDTATSGSAAASEHEAQHAEVPAPKRRSARLAIIALSIALVAALGAGAYLAVLSNQWHDRSGEWESESRELGEQVANLTTDLSGITSDLENTREQLTTAQARITELADEKAQVGDDRETQKLIATDVQAVAEAAVSVAQGLSDCITSQSALIGFLSAPDTTTPEGLQASADETNRVCKAAVDSYNALLTDLSEQ